MFYRAKGEDVPATRSSFAMRYGVAASAVGAVFVLKLLLDTAFAQDATPFRLFLAAVVVATFYGGLGPGVFATTLVVPIVDYFFLPPVNAFTGLTSGTIPLGLFLLEGILVSALVAALRSARERAQKSTKEAQEHRESLRESEERFRTLVEGVKDYAIFMLDPAGRVASWNEGARRIKGYEFEEIIGRHFSVFYTPEDIEREHPEEELRIASQEGRYEEEGLRVRKDGSRFWADVLITALRDEEGNLCGFSKVTRDVTERKENEEELRRSEERYRTVVRHAAEGIFLVDVATKHILETNGAYRNLLDYTVEEFREMTLYDVVAHDRESVDLYVRRVLEEGSGFIGERQHRRKDGSLIDVEVGTSMVSHNGRAVLCVVVHDVTERKRAEEELRRSEERFRALVQNASDVITVLKADGTIRYESPSIQRVLGYRPDELVGKNAFSYLHPDDREKAMGALAEAVQSGESTTVELRFSRKDGSWCHLEAVGSSLLEDPSVRGVVVNSRDVTERKRAEMELRRSLDSLLALYEAGQVLGSSLGREQIGSKLLEITQRISNLSAACIDLRDEDQQLCTLRTVGAEDLWRRARSAPEAESARRAALETAKHQSFELRLAGANDARLVALYLPLRVRNRVIGLLEACGPEAIAENETVETLTSLANQGASALENARLYEELAERERELHVLVRRMLVAQDEERRRVAYDVHDGLTQMVVAAHQRLQLFAEDFPPGSAEGQQDLEELTELVRRTVAEARRVIADLRPTTLDDFGLATAVRLQIDEMRASGYEASYEEELGEERLPAALETALFRVVQEALTNVRKHARTDRILVALGRHDGVVRLEVRDWGHGFRAREVEGRGGPGERIGLSSMRERVALLGGDLEIRSEPGEGTSVVAEVPLPVIEEAGHGG